MLTNDALVAAIESSSHLLSEVPGQMMRLDLPGVAGYYTHVSHPMANSVGAARLTEGDADVGIRAVKQFFFDHNLALAWTTGPLSTPADLPQRLARAGFTKSVELAGLALTDLATPFPCDAAVQVREASDADRETLIRLGTEGFELPEAVSVNYVDSFLRPGAARVRSYLAYAAGSDIPGAFAALLYFPDTPIVSLAGAATLPSQRGKGLYSALVARRLADAHKNKMQAAIINAVRTTSAPILKKRGFVELCGMEVWEASPEEGVLTA